METNPIKEIKKSNHDLSEAEISGILYILLNVEKLTNSELIRLTGFPKEVLSRFKTSIASFLLDPRGEEIRLNEQGRKAISDAEPKPYKWSILDFGSEETRVLEEKLFEIRKKYDLEPKREFDQFFATPETSAKKSLVLKEKGLVAGKNIMLLGDDDLVSIALGLSGENYQSITVVDVDERILNTIKSICEDMGIKNVRTLVYDAKKELKPELYEKYDVILTDPPYTKAGVELFLNRAVQMLSKSPSNQQKYILLFYGNSFKTPEKFIKIQEVINRFGLVIEDKIDKFARYFGAEAIGSASSLYILKATPSTRALEEPLLNRTIYTYENQKDLKFPFVDHVVVKVYEVPSEIIKSKSAVTKAMGEFCNIHKLKVVDKNFTEFKGGGLSLTLILANSNLVVHTWPEMNALHLDLITCAPIYMKSNVPYSVEKLFGSSKIEYCTVE